ncbi:hypothetical protein OWM54_02585 [Myxococcus sp. MISCRS1]|uniref:tetratricopeptide repeat protein n=1 Tax=unclassified Myxococcus TaxID=2648731 RepID=UPI001CBBB34C|nr:MULTISPECIES: hypothetical protein [unclassified Myxococcus]MBZ4399960.1 hypothetical protein [Myxococcus sp. AS-1-15]MCY0996016.1 hypothetical protein [Myxococcus sp. MISCRS1]
MGSQRANQLVEAGLWLRLSGDAQGAQKLFERALELDPQNVRARDCLASLEASPGKSSPFSPGPLDAGTRGTPLASLEGDWGAWAEGEGGPLDEEDEERSPSVLIPDVDEPTPGSDVLELLARDESTTQEYGIPEGETDEYGVPATESELERLLRGAADLLELDDHSGAVDLLFKAQELAPGDPRVEALRARSERMLMAMLESKLGDLGRVPRVRLQADDIIWLSLDHRAGFVLAQIDGAVTFEDLFSLSGMTRLDTARILAQLLDEGVIAAA